MRNTAEITITAEGRDLHKTFILTELPAYQAEAWGIRALGVMIRAGLEVPTDVILNGMGAIAVYGLRGLFGGPPAEVIPLMDEMMTCVAIKEPALPMGRALTTDDIEEIQTRIRLRDEVIRLHTNFSPLADLLTSWAQAIADRQSALQNIPTSEKASEPSSPVDTPA